MFLRTLKLLSFSLTIILQAQWLYAQQASEVNNPYLVLVRDPSVHAELRLTPTQQFQIQRLTDQIDMPLWKMRGLPRTQAQAEFTRLLSITDKELSGILSPQQKNRFHQIILRVQQLEGLFRKNISTRLKITTQQQDQLRTLITNTQKELTDINDLKTTGESEKLIQEALADVRKKTNEQVLAILSDKQRQQWASLMGAEFDLSKLGNVKYKAPEFASDTPWIHSPPLRLSNLRGSVVVLHYMAFGCINCKRNYPWYKDWVTEFAGEDFQIIGIHTPETEDERVVDNLTAAMKEAEMQYPIIVDNDKKNWSTWGNTMWPTVYLIDKQGYVRTWWMGELNWKGAGMQKVMKQHIRTLLAE